MSARDFLDSIEPHFTKGGKLEKYYGLYEMVDTFIYTPATVTSGTTHVRDGNDLKRTMTFVVIATFFCILMAMYNSGYQANLAMQTMGLAKADSWRSVPMMLFGYNPSNPLSCMAHGALFFFPIYFVTLAVGGVWEVLFATVRGHEVNEGFLVSSMLYTLFVADQAGEILGFADVTISEWNQAAQINQIAVALAHRRKGIGTRLMRAIITWARQKHLRAVLLDAPTKAHPAIRLAQKQGFAFCGYHDQFYPNRDITLFFALNLR